MSIISPRPPKPLMTSSFYTNVWLMEQHGWVRAGESYPSGGGVSKVLDIYKWYNPAP